MTVTSAEARRMDLWYFRELARQLEALLCQALAERRRPDTGTTG